jgi:N utilization substance protein A
VVSELSGERIDIVPWHPDPEIFARRALAPAKVSKVISDSERHVMTAIVDEEQLSLAIGRNGQNVRLAAQLIGWQIDLYSSRDWLSRNAEASLFGGDDEYEVSDFPLSELDDIQPTVLAALQAAGINTFFDVLDMDREDFVQVPGIGDEDAALLLALIDELTVEDEALEDAPPAGAAKAASAAPQQSQDEDVESEDAASTEDVELDAAEEAVSDTAVADAEDEPVSDTTAEDGEPVGAAVADQESGVEPAEETDESKE